MGIQWWCDQSSCPIGGAFCLFYKTSVLMPHLSMEWGVWGFTLTRALVVHDWNSKQSSLFRCAPVYNVGRFPSVQSGWSNQSVIKYGTHEFSELVLARMALLMVQSRLVLPLQLAKMRELGELWWEKCM